MCLWNTQTYGSCFLVFTVSFTFSPFSFIHLFCPYPTQFCFHYQQYFYVSNIFYLNQHIHNVIISTNNIFYFFFLFVLRLQYPDIYIYVSHENIQNNGIEWEAHRDPLNIWVTKVAQRSACKEWSVKFKGLRKLTYHMEKMKAGTLPYTMYKMVDFKCVKDLSMNGKI